MNCKYCGDELDYLDQWFEPSAIELIVHVEYECATCRMSVTKTQIWIPEGELEITYQDERGIAE